MAKPIGPLLSQEAHGQIGKSLIFSKRKSGQQVRQFHKPTGARTGDQLAQREIIAGLTAYWQTFSAAQKKVYNDLAKESGKPLTGFNMYIRLACADLKTHYGLVGFWPAEELSGNTVFDKSGNGKDGTLYGGFTRVDGVVGKALKFNGSTGYCGSAYPVMTDETSFTFFAKRERINEYECFFSKGLIVGGVVGCLFRFNPNNKLYFYIFGPTFASSSEINIIFTDFDWHQYTVLCSKVGNFGRVYCDGILLGIGTNSVTSRIQYTDPFNFGRDVRNESYFKGTMDDLRMYNRILSLSEITKIRELRFSL